KKGRIHAAFSALETLPGAFGSATLSSLAACFSRAQINPLDKYCLAVSSIVQHVVPAKAGTYNHQRSN
ncbi:MAG TPA: hypothetical protein VGA15_04015, partial [Bradyrhizobium sp.]